MQIIRASSAAAYSSLQDIALAATMTSDLFSMQSLPAVNAVLSALGKVAVEGLDLPSLKAAGCHFLTFRAAGFDAQSLKDEGFTLVELKAAGCDLASAISAGYDVLLLIGTFGYRAVAASGCDVSMCLLRKATGRVYATLHGHKVDDDSLVPDGDKPVPVPAGWKIYDQNEMLSYGVIGVVGVCGSNPWQCEYLVMADGRSYGTAMCRDPDYIGKTCNRWGNGKCLKQDAEGTRSTSYNYDVLLENYAS